MLTEPDGTAHGAKRGFLKQPEVWRAYDPALFDALAQVQAPPQLSDLLRIETESIVPGATFFNEFVPDARTERDIFHARCMAVFADSDLVFFDPDNGLEVKSTRKGRKRSSKYVRLDEVADHYGAGRSVLIYQHLDRSLPRRAFVEEKATTLRAVLAGASLSAFDTAHVVFLLAARPEHAKRIIATAIQLERHGSPPKFLSPVLEL